MVASLVGNVAVWGGYGVVPEFVIFNLISIYICVWIACFFDYEKLGANVLGSYSLASIAFAVMLFGLFICFPVFMNNDGDLSSLFVRDTLNGAALIGFGSFFTVAVFWLIARPDKIA